MIIQLYSDLHLEYLKSTLKFESKSDILILAGDIGQIHLPSYKFFIDYVSDNWEKTFIVLGNHEYYSDTYTYSELRAKYHLFFEGYSNVTLLDKSCEIYKDIQFMGCTLWGNYPDECDRNYVNCLNRIHYKKNNIITPITKQIFNEMNSIDKQWILDNIDLSRKTVLITHYPSIINGTSSPKWDSEKFKTIFATDLPIKHPKELICLSGHTHYCYDFIDEATKTRHIGNHRGYKDEIDSGETDFNVLGLCKL